MKHTLSLNILSVMAFMLVFTACSKHEADHPDDPPPAIITFSSPVQGAVYNNGDSIAVQAIAIAPNAMHGYDVSIKKVADGTTYFFQHIHDHNDTLAISQKWKDTITLATSLEAQVTVYLDHDLHTTIKKVAFNVQ